MGLFNFKKRNKDNIGNKKTVSEEGSSICKSSIVALCLTIYQSSFKATNALKSDLSGLWKSKGITESDKKLIWFFMLSEFIYCYLNILDKLAFSALGKVNRVDYMNNICLIIQCSVIESIFEGWDEERIEKYKKYFLDGYNESQRRYSKAKELIDKKNPLTGHGTFSILAREIADINKSSMNPEIIMRTIEIAVESYADLNFNDYLINYKHMK